MISETYVISIYRRGDAPGKEVAGLIEQTGSGERRAFSSSPELWAFLTRTPLTPLTQPGRKRKQQTKP